MNNQIKNNKEKIANSKISQARRFAGTRNAQTMTFLFYLLFIICCFSCDLFTGPKVDLFQVISKEVDWANAEKLTVRLDYPSAWGTSNPVQGALTPAMDIRKGYEFSVEFTPDMAYTLKAWMVFSTSKLAGLTDSGSWVENPDLITDANKIQTLGPDDVTLPAVIASGGTFKFTIYTTEPVTLVPWCDTQPRITRTEPRNSPNGQPYSRATDIVLYFNGALKEETVKFADDENSDGIWITSKTGDTAPANNKDNGWFLKPEYAAVGGFFTITMNTTTLTPADSLMTVTVKGIRNAEGESMDEAGYTFSWKTSAVTNISLNSYTAAYADNSGSINVSWTQSGADTVVTYYRLNKGSNIPLLTSAITDTNSVLANNAVITGVNALNDSGVREGRSVSGIEEYTVFIDLYAQGIMESRTTFKIWNFPGMSVSNTNSAIEVDDLTKLAQLTLNDANKQYVLAADIIIPTAWTPIGNDSSPFKGKFYGNGRTITLNGGFNGDGDLGLFGYAEDATIRDLTLVYNYTGVINIAPSLSTTFEMYQANINEGDPPSEISIPINFKALRVGGLAGHIKNSKACNIITSGGTITVKTESFSGTTIEVEGLGILPDGGVLLGGIAGYVEGSIIENCRAALSTKYISGIPDGQQILMGLASAIAGIADGGSIGKATIDAKVDINATNTFLGVIGGAVGISQHNTLTDITFSSGTVSFSGNSEMSICAGIVGMSSMVTMESCSFLGDITATTNANVTVGGLVGNNETNSGGISNCRVQGNINLKGNGSPTVGGFLGVSKSRSVFTMENCFFNGGNITVEVDNVTDPNKLRRPDIGGFAGSIAGKDKLDIINCGTLSGTLTVNVVGILRVGGFISYIEGEISGSFSRMDIVVESTSTSGCSVGGFAGMLTRKGEINGCFATGTVSVVTNSVELPYDRNPGEPPTPERSGRPSVGGLVGRCSGIIQNSYALGNVVLYDGGKWGPAAAGGLVGRIDEKPEPSSVSIKNCFSAGMVSSQYTYTGVQSPPVSTVTEESRPGPDGGACSGGIAGYSSGMLIQKTAALGRSVIARGNTKEAGRILGSYTSGASNNYALKTMFIGLGAGNSTDFTQVTPNVTIRDGQDADSSVFFDLTFWRDTLSFSSTNWDFSRVARDGYPRLAWEK